MKKILIVIMMITILLSSSCVKKETIESESEKPNRITLSEIGNPGKLGDAKTAYEILDMGDFDIWVLYIKKDKLEEKLTPSNNYTVSLNGKDFLLKQNPFNTNILKLLLPDYMKPETPAKLLIKTTDKRENGLIKNDIPLTIEKIYITKVPGENGTVLNEISVDTYTDLYSGSNNFAYDAEGDFLRPTHVKSNEENAYTVNTYFDARTVATTESATAAFQFLKDVVNYESHIIMENPNRFRESGRATELLAPDNRWRIRQIGTIGELNGNNVFNIVDDESNDRFILSMDKAQLPATYTGTYFWETQLKEATVCWFDKTEDENIFETIIDYTDAPSTELILNSRFQAVEYEAPDVQLLTPADGGGVGDLTVTLTWEATAGTKKGASDVGSREANTLEITEYKVYFATDSVAYPEPATTTNKEMEKTGLQYGTTYKWTVEAIQNDTQTASPASHTFTVGSIVVSKDGDVVDTYEASELKQAVENAADGSVVEIAVDLTVGDPITIDGTEVTIRSMKDENVTLDWGGQSKGFTLSNGASVTLERLNIINCANDIVEEAAALTMSDSTLKVFSTEFASNTGNECGAILGVENNTI